MVSFSKLFGKSAPAPASPRPAPAPIRPTSEADWARHRAPEREHDQKLSVQAQAWMSRLPAGLQPVQTAQSYPRILNRVALCWGDPVLANRLFDDLLVDVRGTRRGFPAAVSRELMNLREAHDTRPIEQAKEDGWDLRLQASSDR